MRKVFAAIAFSAVSALASTPVFADEPAAADPKAHQTRADGDIATDLFPETSRYFHELNMKIMHAVKPAIEDYRLHHMSPVHKGIGNVVQNLKEPLNFANSLLGLDLESAARAFTRFCVNSTLGLLGIMDVAAEMGVKHEKRRFGDALGAWGVPMGGFFVLPIFAQTNTRDMSGKIVDGLLDPMYYITGVPAGLILDLAGGLIDVYDGYDFIISTDEAAVDSYSTFKTMYLQNRSAQIERHRLLFKSAPESARPSQPAYDFDME